MNKNTGVSVGDYAPSFNLKNQNSENINLEFFQGKWVILYFYPKDNTPGCTTEALDFSDLKEKFEKENAIILGVSPDSCASHKKFSEKKSLTVTLLSDEDKSMMEAFGVWQLKKLYGREFMGVVRTTFLINPQGVIKARWDKVKVKEHAEKVLIKLLEEKSVD